MAMDNTLSKDSHSSVNYTGLGHNRSWSLPYTKKWRMLIALLIGVAIIGVCILVFYLSAESKKTDDVTEILNHSGKLSILATDEIFKSWRDNEDKECLTSMRDSCPQEYGDKSVLLLVLGGLRTDQISEIPALQEFVKCGSSAKSLVPTYPTFDYPNLYSIATGLYSESHGIVGNEMFDDELQKNFSIGSPTSFHTDWWGGEPIWNTAAKAGKKTATYLWPGSNIQIQGRYPTYWQKEIVDFITRIKVVVDWIARPENERPQLIMMYYEQPVKTSQEFGPFSPKTVNALSEINLGLDELMTILDEEGLINCVDIIVASDHGVAASACDDSIYIDELLDDEEIPGRLYTGTVGRIDFLEDADKATVSRITQKLQCTESSLRALDKNEVPIRYHYTNNPRIGDLILDARSGTRIATEKDDNCLDGEFGYDILARSMQGVFVAHGPSFKVGFSTDSYRNVEIYNLLSQLLDVEPAPNNGTRGSLLHLLKSSLVDDSLFEKPEVSYLKESIKSLPSRPNDAVLGKFSEVDLNSVSCPCVQESPLEVTHVEIAEKATLVENVESSPMLTSTTQKHTSTSSTTTTTTTETSSSTSTTTTTEIPAEISSSSSTSSTSVTEPSVDSREIEITTLVSEVAHSASSRALDSELVFLDSMEVSNTTNESILDHHNEDEPKVDETDIVADYEESVVNSTLEGTHYIIENTTYELDNDSDTDMIQTTETNTTFARLAEPRHIAEIILSHEDIRKALEDEKAEATDISHVTEAVFSDTTYESENESLSSSDISQASVLPSEVEDILIENEEYIPPLTNYVHTYDNDTTEELILETTTVAEHINLEDISVSIAVSPKTDTEPSGTEVDNIEETLTEKDIDSANTENLVPEKIEEDGGLSDLEIATESIDIEYTTKLPKEEIEIPILSETMSNSETHEPVEEHTIVKSSGAEVKQSQEDMINVNEDQVPTTEIIPSHNEDPASDGSEFVTEITLIDNISPTHNEPETVLETDLEAVEVPKTSTPSLKFSSEKVESQAIPEPEENAGPLETSTPSLESNSEKLEIQAIPEPKENVEVLETSTSSLKITSDNEEIQAIPKLGENLEILETSTPNMESSSEKVEIQAVLEPKEVAETPEASTPTLESKNEKIEIQPIPDALKSMSLIKEPKEREIKDIKTLSSLHCPWGCPSYSAPEVSSDTLNILPHSSHIIGFPESLSLGVWTSFTLSEHRLEELHKARPIVPEGLYVSPEEKRSKMPVGCWISDSRLQRSSSDQCSRTLQKDLYESKNVSLRQLFPEDLEFPDILNKEGYLLSNLAPVRMGYEEGPRSIMINAIKKWAKQRGPINVVHGPVFDYDNDGKRDNTLFLWDTVKPLIPSSYYFVVSLCNETKESESSEEEHDDSQTEPLEQCPLTNLNVYSFLFPNTPEDDMCLLSPREYLQYYMASLADVEEVTSLYFFKNMEYKNKVQVRARQPLRIPSI